MESARITNRAIICNDNKILLVRNGIQKHWYLPGGGWQEGESLHECLERELYEELTLHSSVRKLLFVQEYYDSVRKTRQLELFWLVNVANPQFKMNMTHDEWIDKVAWFDQEELQSLTVYPAVLKDKFWDELEILNSSPNPYIGISGKPPFEK